MLFAETADDKQGIENMLVDLSEVCMSQRSHECMTKTVILTTVCQRNTGTISKDYQGAKLEHLEEENKLKHWVIIS